MSTHATCGDAPELAVGRRPLPRKDVILPRPVENVVRVDDAADDAVDEQVAAHEELGAALNSFADVAEEAGAIDGNSWSGVWPPALRDLYNQATFEFNGVNDRIELIESDDAPEFMRAVLMVVNSWVVPISADRLLLPDAAPSEPAAAAQNTVDYRRALVAALGAWVTGRRQHGFV